MIRLLLFIIVISFSVTTFAQKEVRKNIRKGNAAYKEQLYSKAEEAYTKAIAESEIDTDALYNLANTYYKEGKWDDALKTYESVIKIEKDEERRSHSFSNMGNTYLKKESDNKNNQMNQEPQGKQGQQEDFLQKAIESYKNALRNNPNDEETRNNLAIAQKLVKDNEDNDGDGEGDNDQDNDDQNQDEDQNQDQNNDNQDNNNQDEKQDQDQGQNDNQDQNQDQNNESQGISQENMQQILDAIEQDEKETQEKVNQIKADERKDKNARNKELDKDW